MSHHSAQGEELAPGQAPGGKCIEGAIRIGISNDRLLGTASIVKQNHAFSRFGIVGDNHLLIEMHIPGYEQIQMHGAFLLALDSLANEQESV